MPKKEEQKNKMAAAARDERIKAILGIFLILFSLYSFVVFISYLFTWKIDQSFNWSNVFSGPDVTAENWGGKFGAWLANLFINKWFGIASLILPFIILIIGFRLLKIRLLPLGKLVRSGLIATILFSVIFGFIFSYTKGYLVI